jgi:glycosyltransferase involved in cell wall biosynthesis
MKARALPTLLIVTDAWRPQLNGVVRTLEATVQELERLGYAVHIIAPGQQDSLTVPLPFYPEIRLEPFGGARIARMLHQLNPDLIHIATEGPLGLAAAQLCQAQGRAFTTAYHTRFPEYIAARFNQRPWLCGWGGTLALRVAYAYLRYFHRAASAVLVATPAIAAVLRQWRVAPNRLVPWSRGVDMAVFTPATQPHSSEATYGAGAFAALPRPIALAVGRVAVEKNLRAFLEADFSGSKLVIGDGPELNALKAAYPAAHFIGAVADRAALARYYQAADVFVFPSKTDTFGLVLLEAMACGLPVAACQGPAQSGIFAAATERNFFRLNDDLGTAMGELTATPIPPELPRQFVSTHYSWEKSTQEFIAALHRPPHRAVRSWVRDILLEWALLWPLRVVAMLPTVPFLPWALRTFGAGAYRLWRRYRASPSLDKRS